MRLGARFCSRDTMRQLGHQPVRNPVHIYCLAPSIVMSTRLMNDSKFVLSLECDILACSSRTLLRNMSRQTLISSAEALAQSFATIFLSTVAGIDRSDSPARFANGSWSTSVLPSSVSKANITRASKAQLQ